MTDTQQPTLVAVTGEDARFSPVRRRALERARETGARLILYDVDAGRSPLESPLPTNWSADREPRGSDDRLGPDDLEALGRGPVADQVRHARAAGIDAWGWLPDDTDPTSLAGYATRHAATLLVVPDEEVRLAAAAPVEVEVVAATSD